MTQKPCKDVKRRLRCFHSYLSTDYRIHSLSLLCNAVRYRITSLDPQLLAVAIKIEVQYPLEVVLKRYTLSTTCLKSAITYPRGIQGGIE